MLPRNLRKLCHKLNLSPILIWVELAPNLKIIHPAMVERVVLKNVKMVRLFFLGIAQNTDINLLVFNFGVLRVCLEQLARFPDSLLKTPCV